MIASASAVTGWATTLITVEEAIEHVFPGSSSTRETLFLTDQQELQVEAIGGSPPVSPMATRFVVTEDGVPVGYAYLETHRVRTLPETLLIVVGADGRVVRVEVVVFREPLEYIPHPGWYKQFEGRGLKEDLSLKRGIRPVTGATLTARATTNAVRRVLAMHEVVMGGDSS
jgi:hypothetical protein